MKLFRTSLLIALVSLIYAGAAFAQGNGSITGSVTDAAGAVIPGATVTAVAADGKQKQVITNARGEYSITALPAGKYTLKAIAKDFGLYQNPEIEVAAGQKTENVIVLVVSEIKEVVNVDNNVGVSTDPDHNSDATVMSGKDLDALPDDPDEMQAALLALVGAAAGPNGGQIYIDGFTGGQMPSKDQIREIRINSNPFSAEYDRPGSGRVEILTRPGSDKWRGSANGQFNDESLNSRNPFAPNRAPTQQRNFGGSISGPLQKKKSSFSLEVNNRDNDNNALINAQILDPSFNIIPFRRDVRQPTKRLSVAPRVDFTINPKNTLVARYTYNKSSSMNQGIGGTGLPSLAYVTASREHEVRITETMVINAKTVDETRFEFTDSNNSRTGDNSIPQINVTSSFTNGGASVGHSFTNNKTWELNNFVGTSFGKSLTHSVKIGGKLRHVSITDRSESNYAGTFVFNGFLITSANACDVNGDLYISSIEQYRCKLQGGGALYNPTSYSVASGNPQVGVSQVEGALFASDDWKFRPDLMISVGMRYENQSNISSNYNFAPRIGIAWSPGAGGAKQPKFVFRGGGGIFYNRFGENNTLNTLRYNGLNQLNLLVSINESDPTRKAAALDLLNQPIFTLTGVTNVPTVAQITAKLPAVQSNTLVVTSPIYQAPYTMLGVFSVTRAISPKLTFTTTFNTSRSLHQQRTRNINAPIAPFCPTPLSCVGAPRPQAGLGNINEYESGGVVNQNRLGMNIQANLSPKITLFANYSLGYLKSNVSSPAYAYDLSSEYGRDGGDVRHNVNVFGNFGLPWGLSISPNINFTSGRPYNIVLGQDFNSDGSTQERPTFAQLQAKCTDAKLTYSFCNVTGKTLTDIIPRNYGVGPHVLTINTSIRKNFGFGKVAAPRAGNANGGGGNRGGGGGGSQMAIVGIPGGGGGGGAGGGGGGGRGGFGGGGFGGGDVRHPYNLSVGLEINNLFNMVNLANPIGNMASSRFGQSTATAGGFGGFGGGGGGTGPNRRVTLNMRFNW